MDHKIVQPFIDAAVKVLETMAFVSPGVGETEAWQRDNIVSEIFGIVGLSNENAGIKGFLAVGFTKESICQVVNNMLGEEMHDIDDEVREAVGEIANMISGQARQKLSSIGVRLQASLPSVVGGKDITVNGSIESPFAVTRLHLDNGPIELGICMQGLGE